MQMTTLDLERTNLDDEVIGSSHYLRVLCFTLFTANCFQGAIALCEMVEFYGCATRLIFASNNRLRPRAWLTIGRMLKKVLHIIL